MVEGRRRGDGAQVGATTGLNGLPIYSLPLFHYDYRTDSRASRCTLLWTCILLILIIVKQTISKTSVVQFNVSLDT